MNNKDSDRGLTEYKAFIDAMVEFVKRQSVKASRIRLGEEIFHGYTEHDTKYNLFVHDLPPEQRELVADLIQEERWVVIHDVLALLTWEKYRLSRNGIELAFEPFGTENYYDLTARLQGDTWPDERTDEENP